MTDKPLNEYDMALQKFDIFGFNKTKIASMIYGLSRSKGESLRCSAKSINSESGKWIKST